MWCGRGAEHLIIILDLWNVPMADRAVGEVGDGVFTANTRVTDHGAEKVSNEDIHT